MLLGEGRVDPGEAKPSFISLPQMCQGLSSGAGGWALFRCRLPRGNGCMQALQFPHT